MPLPLFFIGAAVATGAIGGGKTIKAVTDNTKADRINRLANSSVENSKDELDRQRKAVSTALDKLGAEKLDVLHHDVMDFVTSFEKIKNIDFQSSVGLEELKNLHIDENTFQELKELGNFAIEVAGGVAAGAVGGALTALPGCRRSWNGWRNGCARGACRRTGPDGDGDDYQGKISGETGKCIIK